MVLGLLFSCGGKDEPVGGTSTPIEDADTDTDTDTDTDADADDDADADGFTVEDGDCDDGDPSVYPGATEYCNSVDDDCDGQIDEDDAIDAPTWYTDGDGDSYGDDETGVISCDPLPGTVAQGEDCDDTLGSVNPGADELCNEVDDDCDGEVDEDDAVDASTWYVDEDGDGYGTDETAAPSCSAPSGTVIVGGDCADDDPTVHPEQDDSCDGVDNDCDGELDEDVAEDWFAVSSSWEEMDVVPNAYPVWIGIHPLDDSVWAVTRAPTGVGGEQGPAFLVYEEGVGFTRQDSFTPDGVQMDVHAATFDEDGMIWVTGRLETVPGDLASSEVLLLRFDPETLEVEELHLDDELSSVEFALDIASDAGGVWLAGRRRSLEGQFRASLWFSDGTETTLVDSVAHPTVIESDAGYTSLALDAHGLLYMGGQMEDEAGVAQAVVRGGDSEDLEDLFSYATGGEGSLNDEVRDIAVDADGVLWFTVYHREPGAFDVPMFDDWRLYTGPTEGPFEVVDTFTITEGMPSFGRSVAVHPTGVIFTTGVALDTSGGSHLIVRAGRPPDMFTSLNDLRDASMSKPDQGTYARSPVFAADGTVWLIEGWLHSGGTTETGEETFNTRIWRMSCL
jgi:hypothetical protein